MIRDGVSGTWSGRSSSAAGAAGAPARRAPPPQAATTSNAPHHRTFIGSPSLPRGPTAGGVVRRRTTREPIAKRVGFLSQPPFLEDRQRHRAHAALGRTVVTPFRYPLHVWHTSTRRVCSPSSGVR